ncbi:hypothetical protein SK128_020442 [Halocaridina rubra]|uniref:Uncharacterized protein n=1 Tax=Halocaridina rubra TaxID=373956 RepID=A0AAN8X944_HALRR
MKRGPARAVNSLNDCWQFFMSCDAQTFPCSNIFKYNDTKILYCYKPLYALALRAIKLFWT